VRGKAGNGGGGGGREGEVGKLGEGAWRDVGFRGCERRWDVAGGGALGLGGRGSGAGGMVAVRSFRAGVDSGRGRPPGAGVGLSRSRPFGVMARGELAVDALWRGLARCPDRMMAAY
jgi:hypothetical protein